MLQVSQARWWFPHKAGVIDKDGLITPGGHHVASVVEALGVLRVKGGDVRCVWQRLYDRTVEKVAFHSRLNLGAAQEPEVHRAAALFFRLHLLKGPLPRADYHRDLDPGLLFEALGDRTEVVVVLKNVKSNGALASGLVFHL